MIKREELLVATTNGRKIAEARAGCSLFDITVEQVQLDIDEIQGDDFVKIAQAKAGAAFAITNKPVAVTDTAWNIPALNGFPGAYMKEVAQWLSVNDFLNLIQPYTDRRICFIESITYKDANTSKVVSKEYWGTIVNEPRGAKGTTIEQLAEFNGKTIAESHDAGMTSHSPKEYVWYEFAKWYTEYKGRI